MNSHRNRDLRALPIAADFPLRRTRKSLSPDGDMRIVLSPTALISYDP